MRTLVYLVLNLFVLLTACTMQEQAANISPTVVESTQEAEPNPTVTLPKATAKYTLLEIPSDNVLLHTGWELVELNGEPFQSETRSTMYFKPDRIEGYTECVEWSGVGASITNDGSFSMPQVASQGECTEVSGEIVEEFVNTITKTTVYTLEGDRLIMKDNDNIYSLAFISFQE